MKILICGMNYAPEPIGIGKYTAEMAEWLADRGHGVRVVAAYPYYPEWKIADGYSCGLYQKQCLHKVTVFRCPIWIPKKLSAVRRIIHLLSFAISSCPVLLYQALIWRPKAVIVVAPNFMCAFTGWLAARLCGARALLHLQDLEIEIAHAMGMIPTEGLYRIICAFERWMLRRFDGVSAIFEAMIECLEKKGVDAKKLYCFPNWVDTDKVFPLKITNHYRALWHIPDETRVALYSGTLGGKHGIEIIIEAARLLSQHPGIRFVLCGSGGLRTVLEKKAKELKNISFYNLQSPEQLNELLNFADIHLLPQSQNISEFLMPSKLTGIFASGRPVIATASGRLAQMIYGRGVVVPPGDVQSFADAIRRLAENDGERKRLGEQARVYAVQHWSKEKVLSAFEKHFL